MKNKKNRNNITYSIIYIGFGKIFNSYYGIKNLVKNLMQGQFIWERFFLNYLNPILNHLVPH
jgi:hypothetical protein